MEAVSAELYGSPWIDSLVTGNLPEEAPDAKDDLFLHYNYDEIKAHQGEYYSMMVAHTNCVQDYVSDKMEEGALAASEGSIYSAAELAQLKILYDQGTDLKTLQQLGVSELQPYLDKISGAASIEELNSVLVSEDFPFSPYLYMTVSAYDMSKVNNVFIYPELLFVDNIEGADYYQDSDDEVVQKANALFIDQTLAPVMAELEMLVGSQEEAKEKVNELLVFEKSYGKDAGTANKYLAQDYGAYGAAIENLSLDEVAKLCPNYPVQKTIEKFGKEGSPFFSVISKKWLETFNSVWIDENLDLIKVMTAAKVIHECLPYLDPQLSAGSRAVLGLKPLDA